MPKTDTGAAAPTLVTAETTFHSCNPDQQHLFAVRPGVSIENALEIASCLLTSALRTVRGAAVEHDDETLFGAIFQLEAVKAIVYSADLATPAENLEGGA